MGRSVVRAGAARCHACALPPRWCVCDALPSVNTRLGVRVLIHHHEHRKPSSTGRLIGRAVVGSTVQIYKRGDSCCPAPEYLREAISSSRALWILHPDGEPLLEEPRQHGFIDAPHVLLLDGTWRQAHEMLRAVDGVGRCVRLPEDATNAPSRYWLRDQPELSKRSTAEALIDVFEAMGDSSAAKELRLHFELRVYATLRSRGKREMAERYLGCSPLLDDARDALDRIHAR